MIFTPDGKRESHSGSRKNIDLLDFHTEKVRDTEWKYDEKPYLGSPFKRHTSSAETHYIYHICKTIGNGVFVELGTMHGGNTVTMAHGISSGKLYTIDLFEDYHGATVSHARKVPDLLNDYFKSLNINKDLSIHIIKGDTSTSIDKVSEPVDFLFIDADHSYEGCKKDWEAWSPKVKIGGIVAFHDGNIQGPYMVMEEIDKACWKFERQIFSMRSFRRIK